ncbi:peptide chain release factor N(5)-glutamine methyltransferase [Ruminiclostridium herbifermentans]|uniref:Release factor glutamine methyltransferase n=1 Tax=Ruminiclostridium herbifermentans TaxID=2488810 RepID=A0A4U7JCM8_9FIRM|nr:peptide chain release factor N(5)-glutamine methyltransferase [Ruminiclostridium herbifermentans]QNU66778.1 peptide chain release factor N(5)-glutamine methyltransferase [Ruminiclostridium herbifermentans]
MNIREYYRYAVEELKSANIEAPELEAGVMLCHVLKCDRVYLYSHYDRILDKEEMKLLREMLNKRFQNVPLQYIIGETEFMGLSFYVSPAVLIPRQDTETLVEECVKLVSMINKANLVKSNMDKDNVDAKEIKILDMCTGSGCIAVSIAHYCPQCTLVACDISQDALNIARVNCERNGVSDRVKLYCGDLFESLSGDEQFNIIVSNPPYIETDVIPELQKEVKNHEPFLALDGGMDGLDFYRKIILNAPRYLTNGGYLALEIGYNQGESVKKLMNQLFCDIVIYKDIGGNDRVVIGRLKK